MSTTRTPSSGLGSFGTVLVLPRARLGRALGLGVDSVARGHVAQRTLQVADRAERAITDGALTIAVTTLFVHAQRDAA